MSAFVLLAIAIIFIAACAIFTRAIGRFCLVFGLYSVFGSAWAALPIEHWQHASGARVYLVPSPAIPMLDVLLEWDGGSRRDSAGKAGLADATATLFDRGTSASRLGPALGENALGEAWADLGAGLGAQASLDRFSISLRSLTEPKLLAQSVQLAARMLAAPAWDARVWQRERARWAAAIAEANTQAPTVAATAFETAVYGSHPYGLDATAQSLARIQVRDIAAFYKQTVRPCAAVVSMVGAIDRAKADALLTQLFAGLHSTPGSSCTPLPKLPEVSPLTQAKDQRIPFQAAQAQVLLGQPGYTRKDPDFFALMLGNYVLGGGGFSSRLTEVLREKRGLVYSVYSNFAPGLHAGAFEVGLQTKPEQAAQAAQLARQVVQEFVEQGITEAELQAAKDFFLNGFALRFDSNRKLLDNIASIAWNQLPLNYLDTWPDEVGKVSVAQVRAAFQRVLQPGRMVSITVGGKP
jgi:zinc protease